MPVPSTNFLKAVEITLAFEGGYVKNSADRGGETNFGISQRSYPHLNIKNLTKEEAIEIYRRDYWQVIKGEELPELVGIVMFDLATNHGINKAILMLQEVISAKQDGRLGPATAIRLNEMVKHIGERRVCLRLVARRCRLYANIVLRAPSQARFLGGWLNRTMKLLEEIV